MIRKFDISKDFIIIQEWFRSWRLAVPEMASLPKHGFIDDNHAAGFLVSTDTNICYLDFFISNPDLSKDSRDPILDKIVVELMILADQLGFKYIKFETNNLSIAERGLEKGFMNLGNFDSFARRL